MDAPWVQALSGGGIAVLSSALAWWGALQLQERADTKRIRNAAQALLADLVRIRQVLGAPTAASLGPIGDDLPPVPRLHPWLHGLVPVLAGASGEAVRRALQLDEELGQREVLVARYAGAWHRVANVRADRDRLLGDIAKHDHSEAFYTAELQRPETELPKAEVTLAREAAVFDTADAALRQNLAALERELHRLTQLRLPDFLPPGEEG